MRPKKELINKAESYTFSAYFSLNAIPKDIASELGYQYQKAKLELPINPSIKLPPEISRPVEKALAKLSFLKEITRREFIIAPILLEISDLAKADIASEYFVEATNYLKGDLDYYLESQNIVLVVEAKQADLARGFNQLIAELVALDMLVNKGLYGIVTTGEIWKFGKLNHQEKVLLEDINLYTVPEDLEKLVQILLGILDGH
ncbi:MAG: hypothetical protein SAK29_04020 [Scytonema sp. PMC 1069.18]|nr:hypothetical protein [Scytonema sp. PMC 1069.18]MEC4884191.1 hypothetical protein [Scytonema sp. PMC 1070.18]